MKLSPLLLSLAACSLLSAHPISVENIMVTDVQSDNDQLIADTNETKIPLQTFNAKSLATLGTHANMNPYSIIQFSPSVNFTPVDPAGSNEPSYHDPIRIRGKSQTGPGGVYSIESLPVSSNPGGGKLMMDMENIASIDLFKGYMPVDKNLGFSSLIGKVDMNILRPSNRMGGNLSQSLGSDGFNRTFVRFDTGKMGDFSAFGSFSQTGENKTKGSGELKRTNAMMGLKYQPNQRFKAELFALKNSDDHHNYYNLSYAETTDLGKNFGKDYNGIHPTTSNDVNYFDWNKQHFDTTMVMANIEYKPTLHDTVSLKPYYKKDTGEYWYSSVSADGNASKNRVIDWQMNHNLFGGVAAYEHEFSDALTTKVGYWFHKQLPPGPPSQQTKYKVVNGQLVYDGYSVLADNGYHTLSSPFIQLSGTTSKYTYLLGGRYQTFKIGSLHSYTNGTSSATSPDYGTAIATGTLDPWSSVEAKTFHTFLPSLYLGYALTEDTTVYLDYSRTYGFDVNLFPSYIASRATFVAKGVTLQQLWDKLNLETSDNIDVGLKTHLGAITVVPNLFVSFVKNKQANIYDTQYGVSYPANVGNARGYGAEFSAYGPINENLEMLVGLSYNKYTFTQNFNSSATTSLNIEGKQLPDAPVYMAKAALSYHTGAWTFTPSARYTASRYGDVQNTQKVDPNTVIDFDMAYRMDNFMGSRNAIFRLTATNVTNEKYLSTINAADNFLAASTTATTYQTGAPFGLFGSINLKF